MGNILIRTGGSREEGLGHLYRSIILGKALTASGERVFLWIDDNGLVRLVTSGKGLPIIVAETDLHKEILSIKPSIIISDLPPKRSRKKISTFCAENNIVHVAIDDIGLVRPEANLLINPSVVIPNDLPQEYISGGKYALIDDSFSAINRERKGIENILISMGGSDPNNITEIVLDALYTLDSYPTINVVVGPGGNIDTLSEKYPQTNIIYAANNMPRLMAESDIAFLSGGITLYEAAASGLATVVIAQNRHQGITASEFARAGTSIYLGLHDLVKKTDIVRAYKDLRNDAQRLGNMRYSARQLIDGHGVSRVVSLIKELSPI